MAETDIGRRMLQARLNLAQRLGREVSKSEIAARLSMPTPTYGRYENGTRKVPSELLAALAAALETSAADLLGEGARTLPAIRRTDMSDDAGDEGERRA